MICGYIRVSTKEQNEDRQLISMNQANIPPENIFMDKRRQADKTTGTEAAKACNMPLSALGYRAEIYKKSAILQQTVFTSLCTFLSENIC